MWIMLSDAFLSVVHKDCADDELLVRARRGGDIERVFPAAVVRRTHGTDYAFRAVIKRADVAQALLTELMTLGYRNFKDSVRDDGLHSAYMSVWSAMGRVQVGGPYGHGLRRHAPAVTRSGGKPQRRLFSGSGPALHLTEEEAYAMGLDDIAPEPRPRDLP